MASRGKSTRENFLQSCKPRFAGSRRQIMRHADAAPSVTLLVTPAENALFEGPRFRRKSLILLVPVAGFEPATY